MFLSLTKRGPLKAHNPAIIVLLAIAAEGCNLSPGSRCGGNAYAHGRLTLPDTGISARAVLVFSFTQRDPDLIPERTDLAIQQTWEGFSPTSALPLVRLLKSDGTVLFEQRATRSEPNIPWKVLYESHDATFRRELFDALSSQNITLQLLESADQLPGTMIRLEPEEQGVRPFAYCA
jgi:hypothetical protein